MLVHVCDCCLLRPASVVTAADVPDTFLLYTNAKLGQVRAMDIDRDRDVMSPIVDVGRPVAIDYHLRNREVYYSDTATGRINKRRLNDTQGSVNVIEGKIN